MFVAYSFGWAAAESANITLRSSAVYAGERYDGVVASLIVSTMTSPHPSISTLREGDEPRPYRRIADVPNNDAVVKWDG